MGHRSLAGWIPTEKTLIHTSAKKSSGCMGIFFRGSLDRLPPDSLSGEDRIRGCRCSVSLEVSRVTVPIAKDRVREKSEGEIMMEQKIQNTRAGRGFRIKSVEVQTWKGLENIKHKMLELEQERCKWPIVTLVPLWGSIPPLATVP